jgi:putative heme-binding domain-containing protein
MRPLQAIKFTRSRRAHRAVSNARIWLTIALCWAGACDVASSQAQQGGPGEGQVKANTPPGKETFTSSCAGCHGLDGKGSERAPNIAGNAKTQNLSDDQISGIISNGLAGTGMPAFRTLTHEQVRAIVSYVRVLQGKLQVHSRPGNAEHGRAVFFGKGECSTCHMISGEGGFMGPDLSAFGFAMSAEAILDAILKPQRTVPPEYKSATVTTRDGTRVKGIVRNEDNFSLQLQDNAGSFHFFQKSDLQTLEYLAQSSMPTNYRERLSRSELNDLASFLMDAARFPQAALASREQ